MAWTGKVKAYRKINSDLPALLDEWATSLFRELDYVREARNGVRFKKLYGELEVSYFMGFAALHLQSVPLALSSLQAKAASGPTQLTLAC